MKQFFGFAGCFVYETEVVLDEETGEKSSLFFVVTVFGILVFGRQEFEQWKRRLEELRKRREKRRLALQHGDQPDSEEPQLDDGIPYDDFLFSH